jgi:hypothetical protein
MTPGNFNWFLHTMLFFHTKYVIEKQDRRRNDDDDNDDNDDDNDDNQQN